MALLKGEGTHQILYGTADIFSGLRHNRGYLSRPDHTGSFPTVLLVHGVDGITASVKSLSRRLARYGLAVVGPDLYRGESSEWPSEAGIASDLNDASQWMASADTPWVQPGLVGLLALDRAAGPAIRFSESHDVVGGAVLISPSLDGELGDIRVPLLGFYGKEDDVVPAASRRSTQESLDHGEWVLYGSVGHGLVDESAADYRWDVAEDIADRMIEYFKRILTVDLP